MWFASLSSNTIPLLQGKHLRGSAMRFSHCSQLIRSLIGPLESLVTSTRFILNSSSKFTRSAWSVSPQTFFWLVTQPSYNQVDRVWLVNTLTSIGHNGSPKIMHMSYSWYLWSRGPFLYNKIICSRQFNKSRSFHKKQKWPLLSVRKQLLILWPSIEHTPKVPSLTNRKTGPACVINSRLSCGRKPQERLRGRLFSVMFLLFKH